ncbi:lysosomal-associated transmembrane protein 5-like [Acipenser ruthenus]|uniref:lysosomal-associated transmembrane protein 5-like n=1 Tax=Acipenser ruthenus TaxID=7906 RepID=UPI00156186F2|nr:lysosomal-associated transmembrane protein 5-like [Acipenser ruthenus]
MTSSKTSPQTLLDSSRSLCCHVRTSAMAIGLVHMMFSCTLLLDTIVKVSYGKDSCGFPHPPILSFKERVLDTTTNFFLIFGMFVTGLSLLYGVLKHREGLLISFLVLQSADIVLSVLSLFYVQLGLPGTLNYEELLKKWTYLNGAHELSPQDVNKFMIIFSTIFILVLLIKIYTVSCVGKCYRFIKNRNQPPSNNECKPMAVLPSYHEALMLPSKGDPPAYKGP